LKKLLLSICLLALGNGGHLSAQSIFGSLVGTVKDPSGAVVHQAAITITNTGENTARTVQTDGTGNYEALNLKPGSYSVTVKHPGFDEASRSSIVLDARQTTRIDFTLNVGSQKQVVSVESDAGVIASETDAISSSYGSDKISTLPANFRASTSTSPYPLLATLPGVQADSGGTPQLSIQGGQPNQSELSIDGISAQSVRQSRPLIEIFPSVESIAEIKVQGVGNSAEYGSAGDITTISKSGTNTYHGAAVWNYQNADFDSTPFGSTSKPAKEVNDYAFSLGGPASLPRIYKGKDKTFFFFTYEGLMYPRTSTFQNYVPTTFLKNGDFTKEKGTIVDPTNLAPFAGNLIPVSRINPISKKIQDKFFPDANNGDLNVAHSNNWNVNKPSDLQSKQFDVRGDHYFSPTQSVFARFSLKNATATNPNNLLQPDTSGVQQNRSLVVSYNYAIRPNLLNEFRAGFTTDGPGSNASFDGKAFQQSLGFQGLPSTPFNGITGVGFNNFTGIGAGRLDGTELYRTFVVNDNLTWNRGAHTIKGGFDFRTMRSKTILGFVGSDNYGNANFTGTFSGNEYADFLLGAPHDTSYGDVQHDNDGFSQRYQAYIQDSWRFNQKLTLEYGVRWDYNPPFHDQFGYIGNFNPGVAKTGQVIYPEGFGSLLAPAFLISVNACPGTPNLPAAGAGLPGVPCTPFITNTAAGLGNGLRKEYKYEFFPRFGFAYRPFSDGNTVVRGGFGIYNAPLLGAVLYSLTGTAQTDVRTFDNTGKDGKPTFYWPNTHLTGSGVSADSYGSAYFGTANAINLKNPHMMQWNMSVDRNIGANTALRVSYIGSHSINLGWSQNYNQSTYSKQFYVLQPLSSRPFPYWGRIENRDSGGTAFYHSLQVEANRRYKNGLTFTGAYTWAKNITDVGGPNPSGFAGETGGGRNLDAYNRSGSRGNVGGTRRHRFIGTALYDLPFGHGRQFMSSANRVMDAVMGGWQLSAIVTAETGAYLTPYFSGADPSGTGSGSYRNQRPDYVGNAVPSGQNANNWFVASAFACPGQPASASGFKCTIGANPASDPAPIGRFGNAGVGILEGPGLYNTSMGFAKGFTIHERLKVRINASYTNIFDRTNYADPNLNLKSSGFGTITSAVRSEFGGARTGQVGARIEF
jgi:hypothetical protein